MPSLSSAQLATMSVELLLQTVMQPERMEHAESVELCFKQLRVLCRDDWTCDQCDRLGANDQIIRLMRLHLGSESVLTQACAVLINLCAGDSYERRDRAQLGGAPDVILKAMEAHPNSAILQEMSFVAMQNISFGSDPNGGARKSAALNAGALPVIVASMNRHARVESLVDQGSSTLRLLIGKSKDHRSAALAAGAQPEWLKTNSFMSSRGFGMMSRRKSKTG